MDIGENIAHIRSEIEQASGGKQIILVAATKTRSPEEIQRAIAAGVDVCGENRVQELLEKLPQGAYHGAPLHFIGHLQKNKVRQLVGTVQLIQGIDSTGLLEAIDHAAHEKNLIQDILLEVNIAAEPSKSGFSSQDLPAALTAAANCGGLRVRGLMAIPPISASPEANRPYFEQMEQLFIDIRRKKYDNVTMDFLSMGMSGDYLTAIRCGANMVRIGSAIFGPRYYQ